MIFLLQLLKMLDKKEGEMLVGMLQDLSFEIEELGYKGLEDELIADILFNHFGLELTEPKQLQMFTDFVLQKQDKPEIWKAALTTSQII